MNYPNSRRYLAGHVADSEKLTKLNMRGTRAPGSKWIKCTFEECHFDASNFAGVLFDRCVFNGCTFDNSVFEGATILESEFTLCDMIQTGFSASIIKQTRFMDCDMEYATFFDADLWDVTLSSNLTGAILLYKAQNGVDYRGANLHDAAFKFGCKFFRGAKFDETHWHMFQSLVSYGQGYERLHAPVMERVNPRIDKLVSELVETGHQE